MYIYIILQTLSRKCEDKVVWKKLVSEVDTVLLQFYSEKIKAERKNSLWPRMTGLRECHSNCGAITGKRWWLIALRSMASPSWRTSCTLAHLWPNLWRWHLKCWFWSTYANCCNFPDEAPFWYLGVAKIVLHFLCAPLCHLLRVVSAQSATESRQNCKQIASDCQHCEKVNCLQIYLNHWPIFISYGTWYSWLLNWRPFLLCSALWCDGKQSLPNQLPFFPLLTTTLELWLLQLVLCKWTFWFQRIKCHLVDMMLLSIGFLM